MKLNRKQFAELFRADYLIVGVHFDGLPHYQAMRANAEKKTYFYKAPKDLVVEIGDWVFVPDADSDVANPNLKRCQVVQIFRDTDVVPDSGINYKWIVGTVKDILEKYQQCRERDVNMLKAVQKLERAMDRVEIQAQMKLAMSLLSPEEQKELTDSFGLDLTRVGLLNSPSAAT